MYGLNLQRVLHFSGNHYDSQKAHDKIMEDIYSTFEGIFPFSFEFRREIVHTNISISDSVYGKVIDREVRFSVGKKYYDF